MSDTNIFQNGSCWLRADFHLHTKADKEFKYSDDKNSFVKDYINALQNAGISLGVVTNHNKFDFGEFKALRSEAKRRNIGLLPGVELSVNDGANGIHVLIVFSEEWIKNGEEIINPFLTSVFTGKTPDQYENENRRCDKNILQLTEELEKINRDYFLIFAHVEREKGLWNEIKGGRLSERQDKRYEEVRKRTLGFQQVRTYDLRDKVRQWFGNWYPAEVEGSDPKCLNDIGRENPCFVKIGSFTFEAIKFALFDYENRIKRELPKVQHSYIRSIEFQGGTLNGEKISFSPELNTLIGIRGSGKSSVIEVLRYALEMTFGENSGDQKYKQELVRFTMDSGGKVIINAIGQFGQSYEIHRIFGESYSQVYIDGQLQPGISIRNTVLHNPLYFGQKDLSSSGDGFEKDLIEKLIGTRLDDVRKNIVEQKKLVIEIIDQLLKADNVAEQLTELTKTKQDISYRLDFYAKQGLEEKLQRQLDFANDERTMKRGIESVTIFLDNINEIIARGEDGLQEATGYQSKQNAELFKQYYEEFTKILEGVETIKKIIGQIEEGKKILKEKKKNLGEIRDKLIDEFAVIERKLSEELKNSNTTITSDEFLKLKSQFAQVTQSLSILEKQGNLKENIKSRLAAELDKLNNLWYKEYNITKKAIAEISDTNYSLKIECGYKEDKNSFLNFMKNTFRGSGIRETTYQNIVEDCTNFIDVYQKLETGNQNIFGTSPQTYKKYFFDNIKTLLTYQVPNKFTFTYRGKDIQHHSLGQRASALMLFLLGQRDNDLIIIDQPEDDLDNQTIYEDVIKTINILKPKVQFIFATHNPNFPVLGDAEQILTCSFSNDKIVIQTGSIDDAAQQKNIIDIMEGGAEAFKRRKDTYQIWKS
ncbi:MAG: hypothetical protein LBG58_01980 [Planctomycetaceae bacterium]|jgi:predicted ATPase|nr:hypothetical protein [Planctomycetaceae bacterium]